MPERPSPPPKAPPPADLEKDVNFKDPKFLKAWMKNFAIGVAIVFGFCGFMFAISQFGLLLLVIVVVIMVVGALSFVATLNSDLKGKVK